MLPTETQAYDLRGVSRRIKIYQRRRDRQYVAAKTFDVAHNMSKGLHEATILAALAAKEDHNNHIVRMFERTRYDDHYYILQELLDGTLLDFKNVFNVKKFKIWQIRVILRQVLMALSRLKKVGIVHSRVHMKNVMLVNHARQPFRVKLIGFGDALDQGEHFSMFIFRPNCSLVSAPEEFLGVGPCSSKTDMWSVGCMAAKMALGRTLFPADDQLELAHRIFGTRGLPPSAMLDSGFKTKKLFDRVPCENGADGWQLKPLRRNLRQRIRSWMGRGPAKLKDLEAKNRLGCFARRQTLAKQEDRRCLGHLINSLLVVDPEQRIDPDMALHHPFFTLQHLRDPAYKRYYNFSRKAYQDADVSIPEDLPPGSWDSFEEVIPQRRRPSLRRRLRSFFARIFICGQRPAAPSGDEGPVAATSSTADLSASATGPATQSTDRDELQQGSADDEGQCSSVDEPQSGSDSSTQEVLVEPPRRRAGFLRRWIQRVRGRSSAETEDINSQ